MKQRHYISIAISLILLIGLIGFYEFGLFADYNSFKAKSDIKKGQVNILIYGELNIYETLENKIAKEFGFEYKRVGDCTISQVKINGIEKYNKTVEDYLAQRNGENWKNDLNNKLTDLYKLGKKSTFDYVILQTEYCKTFILDFTEFWTPDKDEIVAAEWILINAVKNEHENKDYKRNLDSKSVLDYKQQFICYVDTLGNRCMWINGLYGYPDKTAPGAFDWRKNLIDVLDGGDSYFDIKINMDKLDYEYFSVNGEA